MFLTVHAVSGLIIGKYTDNSILAFIIGFLSHIILDAIPHDSIELEKWKKPEITKNLIITFLIEFPLIIIILFYFFIFKNFIFTPSIFWALVGSMILDFLWGFYLLFPKLKFLKIFKTINHASHKILYKKIYLPLKLWLPIQLFFIVLFLIIFIK